MAFSTLDDQSFTEANCNADHYLAGVQVTKRDCQRVNKQLKCIIQKDFASENSTIWKLKALSS